MKLETTILPRRDGTVISRVGDVMYVFSPDASGVLACEVDDDAHVALLIDSGNFYPASSEDYERASELMRAEPETTEPDSQGADDDDELLKMSRADLVLLAEEHSVTVKANDNKAEIVAAIAAKRDAA